LKKTAYAYEVVKDAMEDLRRVVKGLSMKTLEENDLLSALNELISKCRGSGINISFSHKGIFDKIKTDKKLTEDIYNICQEALTNSMKHGKAQNSAIVLNYSNNCLHLYIIDDGVGCHKVIKNKGICNIEEIIQSYNGSILFGSGDDGGFNIKAVIPFSG
jgi:signal transduction histidine kinase